MAPITRSSRCHVAFSSHQHQQRRSWTSFYLACPSLQHPLLPLPDRTSESDAIKLSAADIQHAFRERSIDRVAFIRHGNTAPAPKDIDRELTELGRAQSRAAGLSYGFGSLCPYYEGAALCSPAGRCVETAQLFLHAALQLQQLENGAGADTIAMPRLELWHELYDGTMQPEGSRLFKSLGYAPLRVYLENQNKRDRKAAKMVLGGYASDALDAIWDVVRARGGEGVFDEEQRNIAETKSDEGKTLLFFGHAVYLPSVALGFASAIGCDDGTAMDLILDTNTKEAEGYCVDVDKQSVSLLCRPETSS
ncbi:hypothetical protein ACHAXT_001780 [Thalassiosira profunda]